MARTALTHAEAFPVARPSIPTGNTEMAVAEAAALDASRPARVTALIEAAFETIGGDPVDRDRARSLSAAAREWLIYKAALAFRPDLDWFEAPCSSCGGSYDIRVSLGAAPRKPPGAAFPVVTVKTSLGPRDFEAPCGWHEEAAARAPEGTDLRRVFAVLCGLSETADEDAERFTRADLLAIETALDEMSPDLADVAQAACPACGAETAARIEPLRFVFPTPSSILREVHHIAAVYHWPEPDILALRPDRRRMYAVMIAAERQSRPGRRWS